MLPIFVFGTLRDPDVLALVLGNELASATPRAASLPEHFARKRPDAPHPVLIRAPGQLAKGALLEGLTDEGLSRLKFFEAEFSHDLRGITVVADAKSQQADVFWSDIDETEITEPWTLTDWERQDKPAFMNLVHEIMTLYGQVSVTDLPRFKAGMQLRASARQAAITENAPAVVRSDFAGDGVTDHTSSRIHTGFFAMDKHVFSHRSFGGGRIGPVEREVFVAADAVSVLPYDAKRDQVLLIEQCRPGLLGRGDPNPWNLEVVAGLIDRAENPWDAARREAVEESGVVLKRMEKIAGYYSSPGSSTEHLMSFLGEADLADVNGVFGLDSEQEDILVHVLDFDTAFGLIATGEARNAPLVLSLQGLALARDRLRSEWG